METGHFTRISCWIYSRTVPPIASDTIIFYESKWDTQTNRFMEENKKKINSALATYPSGYCDFTFHPVKQPIALKFESEEERLKVLREKADKHKNATTDKGGVIYCALLQDRGKEDPNTQRIMVFNIEDCTERTIIAAIWLMSRMADKFKDDISKGQGFISPFYLDEMWQVDMAVDYRDLYDSAYDWLEGKNEMYFSQKILEYDEVTHRLWFVNNEGVKDKEFLNHDLMTQAFYLLVWNHPEGVKDYDLCVSPADKAGLIREQELKAEFVRYYQILNPYKDKQSCDADFYKKKVDKFCDIENRKTRDTARSHIKTAFEEHESDRVNADFAQKVAEYYSFDATTGIIKVANRSTTIILPDSLMSDRLKKYNAEHTDNADK